MLSETKSGNENCQSAQLKTIKDLVAVLVRYRNETTIDHQPHMISESANRAIEEGLKVIECVSQSEQNVAYGTIDEDGYWVDDSVVSSAEECNSFYMGQTK